MTEPVSSSCSLLAKLDEDLAKLGRVGKTGNAPDLKLSFSNISDESTTKYPRPAKAPSKFFKSINLFLLTFDF